LILIIKSFFNNIKKDAPKKDKNSWNAKCLLEISHLVFKDLNFGRVVIKR
jgi:hypothetical protein